MFVLLELSRKLAFLRTTKMTISILVKSSIFFGGIHTLFRMNENFYDEKEMKASAYFNNEFCT